MNNFLLFKKFVWQSEKKEKKKKSRKNFSFVISELIVCLTDLTRSR